MLYLYPNQPLCRACQFLSFVSKSTPVFADVKVAIQEGSGYENLFSIHEGSPVFRSSSHTVVLVHLSWQSVSGTKYNSSWVAAKEEIKFDCLPFCPWASGCRYDSDWLYERSETNLL